MPKIPGSIEVPETRTGVGKFIVICDDERARRIRSHAAAQRNNTRNAPIAQNARSTAPNERPVCAEDNGSGESVKLCSNRSAARSTGVAETAEGGSFTVRPAPTIQENGIRNLTEAASQMRNRTSAPLLRTENASVAAAAAKTVD